METLLSKNQHNLIDRSQQFDVNILEDLLMIAAANFEDSLILAGARPGIDYTILDLYKLSSTLKKQRKTPPFRSGISRIKAFSGKRFTLHAKHILCNT